MGARTGRGRISTQGAGQSLAERPSRRSPTRRDARAPQAVAPASPHAMPLPGAAPSPTPAPPSLLPRQAAVGPSSRVLAEPPQRDVPLRRLDGARLEALIAGLRALERSLVAPSEGRASAGEPSAASWAAHARAVRCRQWLEYSNGYLGDGAAETEALELLRGLPDSTRGPLVAASP